jgi:hypothetical protein
MPDMPYRRDGACDICGRHVSLRRVVLQRGGTAVRDGVEIQRLDRAAYICDRHSVGMTPTVLPPADTEPMFDERRP